MEFWQMDVVGGILLADGSELKCLSGVDDHIQKEMVQIWAVLNSSRAPCEIDPGGDTQEERTDNSQEMSYK